MRKLGSLLLTGIYLVHRMDKHSAKSVCLPIGFIVLQWNTSNADTLGTKVIVLISEVSLFRGENDI